MPKRRSSSDKIQKYRDKIRKLEEKQNHRSSRNIDSDVENEVDPHTPGTTEAATADTLNQAAKPADAAEPADAALSSETVLPNPVMTVADQPAPQLLDPDILGALGEPASDAAVFGPAIHENLAQRWLPILRKGLDKNLKENITKEIIVPENCTLLQAPRLNAEISAAITDMSRNRDKRMESQQQQLGIGITAVNRAMSILITDSEDKIKAIKCLSDGCRILSDLHYNSTQTRIKMLTPSLEKGFLNIIKDSERDDTLFGAKLSEKIKASKVIEKQGLQIKNKPAAKSSASTQLTTTTPRPARYQENWAGPPRYPYPTNRGGRGGFRRPAPATPTTFRRPPSSVNKASTQSKPRLQPQH